MLANRPGPGGASVEVSVPTAADSATHDDSDAEFQPEAAFSEPAEEYNEFHGYDPDAPADDNVLEEPLKSMVMGLATNCTTLETLKDLANFRHEIVLHLRLYVMADKYDVPVMRLLARDRFYRAAELQWKFDDEFPDVVDELYSCTPESEVAMREIVCRLVGHAVKDKEVMTKMEPVMRKHGSFAVGVMNYALHESRLSW